MIVQHQCHRQLRRPSSTLEIIEVPLCSGELKIMFPPFPCRLSEFLLQFRLHRETNSPITPIQQIDSPLKQSQHPFLYGFSRSNSPESSDNSATSPNYNNNNNNTNNNGCTNGNVSLNNNGLDSNSIDNSSLLELMVTFRIT